ncbi:hypothetical protein Patl1_02452 [Pistacia atlantica]|uniref:Uncharacterized protein n=1 Tax=Pistacia atlantica TaxID=434234 RepID=A0ACC1CBM9_9ROSI|nr:hypothetical protein Patl1_02452 [Pistacia atlantica]
MALVDVTKCCVDSIRQISEHIEGCYSVHRFWMYREFPIYWSISCLTRTWSTCGLQLGKHVCS